MVATIAAPTTTTSAVEITVELRGGNRDAMRRRDSEVLNEGPAGSGKTLAWLWKLHRTAFAYPGVSHLMVRKTLTSLTSSAVVTYKTHVLGAHPNDFNVRFFGGSPDGRPSQYEYPNGSRIVVGGLDNAQKLMSTEYDIIYANEATDLTLDEWEKLTARNRNGMMPYQQVVADCNPDAPTHWLNQRCNEGKTTRLRSTHKDNPKYWDGVDWTEEGYAYVVGKLGKLTGVRRLRLLDGIWAAAEGIVYDNFLPDVHVIDRFTLPSEWPRYWVIDFGFVHPFVWQCWALSPDGILYREREIYMTGRLVTDHCQQIKLLSAGQPRPIVVITDHDAEDRATFERAMGMQTEPAYKSVSDGIQAVANRLRTGDNGKARLYFLRDSVVEVDTTLREDGKPTCTEEEFPSYIWDTRLGRRKGEQPVKDLDHGMDTTRYLVAYVDQIGESREAWGF